MSATNLILLIARHHRAACTGYAGHPDVKTPNLDALAQRGAWFRHATAASENDAEALAAILGGVEGLRDARAAGYHTVYAGPPVPAAAGASQTATAPLPGGEETARTDYGQWLAAQGLHDQATAWADGSAAAAPSSYRAALGAIRSALPPPAHPTAWLGDQTVRFVRAAPEPFCLVLCFTRPGEPYDPPGAADRAFPADALSLPGDCTLPVDPADAAHCPRFDQVATSEAALRRALAYCYASIALVDQQVGRVLATLGARGLTRNIIAYTALQGDLAGHRGMMGAGPHAVFPPCGQVPLVIAGAPGYPPGAQDASMETRGLLPALIAAARRSA